MEKDYWQVYQVAVLERNNLCDFIFSTYNRIKCNCSHNIRYTKFRAMYKTMHMNI